jgi:hypothetical protein
MRIQHFDLKKSELAALLERVQTSRSCCTPREGANVEVSSCASPDMQALRASVSSSRHILQVAHVSSTYRTPHTASVSSSATSSRCVASSSRCVSYPVVQLQVYRTSIAVVVLLCVSEWLLLWIRVSEPLIAKSESNLHKRSYTQFVLSKFVSRKTHWT